MTDEQYLAMMRRAMQEIAAGKGQEARGLFDELLTIGDEQIDPAELAGSLALLDRSMEDIKAGRVMDAKQAIRDIAQELVQELPKMTQAEIIAAIAEGRR